MTTNSLVVLDNSGKTFDRYTIIDKTTGDMIGASEDPFHPLGFGQYCGNVADNYWFHAYGYSWRSRLNEKKCTKFAIDNFLSDCGDVGKRIKFNNLPLKVQQYAIQTFINS